MTLQFSTRPGAHERRLQRLWDNPLFPAQKRQVAQQDIEAARQQDAQERERFLADFQVLLGEAVGLAPNVESDVILNLTERLDMAYERCSSLTGDVTQIKQALRELVAVIMNSVRTHAADDPQALAKLRATADHLQEGSPQLEALEARSEGEWSLVVLRVRQRVMGGELFALRPEWLIREDGAWRVVAASRLGDREIVERRGAERSALTDWFAAEQESLSERWLRRLD